MAIFKLKSGKTYNVPEDVLKKYEIQGDQIHVEDSDELSEEDLKQISGGRGHAPSATMGVRG
jgi:bacteriocin-like protein